MKKSKDLLTIVMSLSLLILVFVISYLFKHSMLLYFVTNIALLFYTIAVFVSTIYEKNIEAKMVPFVFMIIFSGAGILINLLLYGKEISSINNNFIIGWCGIWGIICFVGIVFFIILIVQLIKYSKETYKEIQTIRAENQKFKTREKSNYKTLKAKTKWQHKGNVKSEKLQIKHDAIIEREKQKQTRKTESKKKPLTKKISGKYRSIKATFLSLLVIFLYIILPLMIMNGNPSKNLLKIANLDTWLGNITLFVKKFSNQIDDISPVDVIFRYTVAYIAIVGVLYSLNLIFHNIIESHKKPTLDGRKEQGFFKTYTEPIIILVFGWAVLSTFIQSDESGFLEDLLESLLKVIFSLIGFFICIEIVRLVKEQCTEPKSILRQCIRYLYILVIKSVMDIVIGILSSVDIKGLIESLLFSILPNNENPLNQKIAQYLEEDFDLEVEKIKEQGRLTIKKRIQRTKSKKIPLRRK